MFLRTAYNYDMLAASDESGIRCDDPSLTVQSSKEECDINTIVERFGLTGKLPTNVRMPQYGDFEGIADYQGALNAVRAAGEAFMSMPAHVRNRFHNDPGAFVDFCANPENRAEAEKLGLVVPAVAAPVSPVPAVDVENSTPPSA